MNVVPIESGVGAKAQAARAEPELSLVPAATAGERAQRLMLEARAASLEHLEALQRSIAETRALAETVVQGGDLYAAGVHDLAGRLAEDLLWRSRSLEALIERLREVAHAHRAPSLQAQGARS